MIYTPDTGCTGFSDFPAPRMLKVMLYTKKWILPTPDAGSVLNNSEFVNVRFMEEVPNQPKGSPKMYREKNIQSLNTWMSEQIGTIRGFDLVHLWGPWLG